MNLSLVDSCARPQVAAEPAGPRRFLSETVVPQSWFAAVSSRSLGKGRAVSFDLLNRRIAVYRDAEGRVHALDARCPHLGADLGLGRVDGDRLCCAFHGWCFGADGVCQEAPGYTRTPRRRSRAYPTKEQWGIVWIFNGPEPLFELPEDRERPGWWSVRVPSQRISCHPHLVIANGLDVAHYSPLHGLRFSEPPTLEVAPPWRVSLHLRGRPVSAFWRAVSGSQRRDVVARFTTIGGNLALTSVFEPMRFDVVFTGRPDRAAHCVTRTVFLVPRRSPIAAIRALGVVASLLHDDRRVLETIDFTGRFAEDEPLRRFAEMVDRMPVW